MKILSVFNRYLQRGGEENSFEMETTMLREQGHDVFEYVLDNRELKLKGNIRSAIRSVWSTEDYKNIRRLIRSKRPEIMHVHNLFPMISPSIYHAAKCEGVKTVCTLRNYRHICPAAILFRSGQICEKCVGKLLPLPAIKYKCYRDSASASLAVVSMLSFHRLIGTFENTVDLFIAISETVKENHIKGGFPSQKLKVKPNFVHPDPGYLESKDNCTVFAGRLVPEKGILTLVRAWLKLPESFHLKIIGTGPLSDEIEKMTKYRSNIEMLGYVNRNDVYKCFGDAALVIVPSEWYEGFGRTVVEAFAVGTPVLVSDIGALNTIVSEGETGFTFRPGDSDDLAMKIISAFADEDLLKEMSKLARREFEEKYTARVNYRQLLEIYQSITEE